MKLFVIKKKGIRSLEMKKKSYNLCTVSNIAIKRINTIF